MAAGQVAAKPSSVAQGARTGMRVGLPQVSVARGTPLRSGPLGGQPSGMGLVSGARGSLPPVAGAAPAVSTTLAPRPPANKAPSKVAQLGAALRRLVGSKKL